MSDKNNITSGPIFKGFLLYTIPIILTGLLQQLYNTADIIVVGRWAGSISMAAVGSTSSLTNLFINLFIGFSAGTSVMVAQAVGAGDKEKIEKSVHTSITSALIFGVFLMIVGIIFSNSALRMMSTPKEVLGEATLYMKIIFAGMPANFTYNFGSAILRASGDTKTPLIFLSISGLINVLLNLIFVIVLGMKADGVGYATIISQYISASLIVLKLMKTDGYIKLQLSKLKIYFKTFKTLMRYSIPAGIQGSIFSFSNVQIQGAVNIFGKAAMAGSAASANVEALVYIVMNSFHHSMLTFTGQNFGAKNSKRIKKSISIGILQVFMVSVLFSGVVLLFEKPLLSLYVSDTDAAISEVIYYGLKRMNIILPTYFLCGLMDCFVGASRGLGTSISTTIISLAGITLGRLGWIYTIFEHFKTWDSLFYSYPVSWFLTALIQFAMCMYMVRKRTKQIDSL